MDVSIEELRRGEFLDINHIEHCLVNGGALVGQVQLLLTALRRFVIIVAKGASSNHLWHVQNVNVDELGMLCTVVLKLMIFQLK